jgi:hypothetical protein
MYLFSQADLIDHHDIVSMSSSSLGSSSNPAAYLAGAAVVNHAAPGIMGPKSSLAKCACLFLKMTDWMQRAGIK